VNHRSSVESRRRHRNQVVLLTWDKAHRRPAYWVSGARRKDGASLIRALMRNCRNLHIDAKGDGQAHPREALSTDAMLQGRIDSQ
jgi:hypothetical protein